MCRFFFFFSFCHSPQRRDCSGSTLIQMISVSKGSAEDNSRGGLRWNNMIKSHPSAVRGNALTETAHPGQAPKITICVSCFMTEGAGKEYRTPPTREFWKGQKETPYVLPPPGILLAGIWLGWAMYATPGKTLNQNDRPKTTQKLIPIIAKAEPVNQAAGAALPGSPALQLSTRRPFPTKSLALSAPVLSLVMV